MTFTAPEEITTCVFATLGWPAQRPNADHYIYTFIVFINLLSLYLLHLSGNSIFFSPELCVYDCMKSLRMVQGVWENLK